MNKTLQQPVLDRAPRSTAVGPARSCADHVLAGVRLLAAAGLHQLRRAGRADRDHASRPGRGATLDFGEAVPARAQLLHAASRARGPAARDLHRLADAPNLGRHRRGGAVRAAVARDPGGVVLDLPGASATCRRSQESSTASSRRSPRSCSPRPGASVRARSTNHFCGPLRWRPSSRSSPSTWRSR